MTREEAAALLGIAPDAAPQEIRTAFRRRLLQRHPDIAGPGGTAPTHELIAAYRVLGGRPAPRSRPASAESAERTEPAVSSEPDRPEGSSAGTFPGLLVHGNTLHVPLAPDHGFVALMEAAHGLGEVAYVDRSAGLLETIVVFDGYPVGSVLCTLERGRQGWTDVTVIVESLTGDAAPPDDAVAALVAERLGRVLRRP